MTEWADVVTILLGMNTAIDNGFQQLRGRLPDLASPRGPFLTVFDATGQRGAGAGVWVLATRADGREVSWCVEIVIDPPGLDQRWHVTVQGDIDLDDDAGEDRCVLNEQRSVETAPEAAAAIRELTRIVTTYPVGELLTMPWPVSEDHAETDASPSTSG